jgi:hypothetical protein
MSQVAGWLGVLRTRSRAFAVLDCVLGGAGDYPTYTFDPQWKPGVALAAMDTGSGDLYAIAFDSIGVFLYGFAHESDLSPWRDNGTKAHWPGLLDGLPPELASYPAEPSFLYEDFFDATVVVWRETADIPRGSADWSSCPVTPARTRTALTCCSRLSPTAAPQPTLSTPGTTSRSPSTSRRFWRCWMAPPSRQN